jgi:hypothetical protein
VSTECAAGRTAFFGGRWTVPCPITGRHRVGSSQADAIMLCDDHFRQVSELKQGNDPVAAKEPELRMPGPVSEATLGEGEFYRSETSRKRRFRFPWSN